MEESDGIERQERVSFIYNKYSVLLVYYMSSLDGLIKCCGATFYSCRMPSGSTFF